MAESVSQLQAKLKALTHGKVNIMADADTFKSTTQILREMSAAWQDMTDIERASALELMGGKRQANILSSLITNFQTVEDVIETASNSQGSAMEENAKWLDSIEGKTTTLKNSMQDLWYDTLNSDTIKFFLDLANAIVKVADSFGLLPTAVGVFAAYKFAATGLREAFDKDSVSVRTLKTELHNYLQSQQQVTQATEAQTAATTSATAANVQETQSSVENSAASQAEAEAANTSAGAKANEGTAMAATAGAEAGETATSVENAAANETQTLSSEGVGQAKAGEEAQLIKTAAAERVETATSVENAAANKTQGLFAKIASGAATAGAAVKALGLAFGKAALLMIGIKVAVELLKGAKQLIDDAYQSTEELIEEWDATKKKVEDTESELENVQSRIEELKSQGVLTFVDRQELEQLRQTNDELERRLRLEQEAEEKAGNSAKARIKSDYEKNFIKSAILTDKDLNQYNKVQQTTDAINAMINNLSGNTLQTLTEEQKNIIKGLVSSDVYDELASKTWSELSESTQDILTNIYNQYQKELQDLSFVTDQNPYVSGETYIDQAIQKIKEYKEELYDVNGQLKDGLDDEYVVQVNANIDELESGLLSTATELYDYIDNYGGDMSDSFVKRLQEQIDKIDMTVNPVEFYNNKFDEIFGKYSDQKRELYELAKQGKLTANVLNSTKYTPLMNEMNKLGVTVKDVTEYINSLGEAEISNVLNPTFNISEYADDIDSIQEKISDYQSALSSLEEGSFTQSDFIDLIQKYPDLAKGVDVASKSFNGLTGNLKRAIKAAPDELIDTLKALREQIVKTGGSTVALDQLIYSIENMPVETVEELSREYGVLTDNINSAKKAQDELKESMSENLNEGFETRGEAIEYMKDKMSRGEIGSESELWSVAEKYGFTYDSAKSINENADALANFIAVREKWYKKDDDGNYTFEGTESFIETVEDIVDRMPDLQKYLTWSYDENTGFFNFDFDYANWDKIIETLSKTDELAGLTSEEFADLIMQIGQFYNINWEDADDVGAYISTVAKSSEDAAQKINSMTNAVESYVEKELGIDIDFSSLDEATINALECDESIKNLLKNYLALKDEVSKNPLNININGDLENDVIVPLKNAGLAVEETIDELGNKQFTFDIVDLETLMRDNGYTTESIMGVINRIFGSGSEQSQLVQAREDIQSIANVSQTTCDTLEKLGIAYSLVGNSQGAILRVDSNIEEVLKSYQFTDEEITALKVKWEAQGIHINTEADTSGVEDSQDSLDGLPEEFTTTINADTRQFMRDMQNAIDKANELAQSRTATITLNTVTNSSGNTNSGVNKQPPGRNIKTTSVNGTAHAQGSWGAPETETSLVGELGPELLVRDGRWTTIGENGAEFTQIKKGDIIFNHKQTEDLLKNGYITSRGKAYASGTAYTDGGGTYAKYTFSGSGGYTKYNVNDQVVDSFGSAASNLSDASDSLSDSADSLSDATDEFEEVFDWVEVRLQEIDETLDLLNAKLENAVGYSAQNSIIDQILGVSNTKMSNLQAGLQEYANYAAKLLAEIPAQYQAAAQDGSIAITKFAGEADEATVEAINNYREWADKVADLIQRIEELKTEIADLAKQKFDNVSEQYDNIITLIENANEKLEAQVDLVEDRGYVAAKQYYESMIVNTKKQSAELEKEKKALQEVLDQQVKLGNIKVGSDAWYEMVDTLYEVDAAIVECTSSLEEYQNAINDIYWDNFDQLINRIDYLNNETQRLIDLMDSSDMVFKPDNENGWTADQVEWTKEGIASLGLYAQQMEIAEYQSKQYAKAIDDLNKDYQAGKYSENEYLEKLDELTSAQYDSIEAYYDAQEAIKDLNEARIDAIKEGIEKEIDAYTELINKKKEELDAEKDLYDFQKSVAEQQKNIADIQRKLSALSGDNSASAIAQRKKLEAELAEAKADLEESYYNRSVSDRSDALDKELEDFQDEKDAEVEKWEKYLDNIEQVVADSLGVVQANATEVYDTLNAKAQEYDLTLSDAIMTPWQDGALAISDYQTTFDTAMSSTWDQLEAIKMKWQEIIDKMAEAARVEITRQQKENNSYTSATYTPPAPSKPTSSSNTTPAQKAITVGGKINAGSATIYSDSSGGGGGKQYFSSDPVYTVLQEKNGYILVRHHSLSSGYSGWFKKSDVKALATGTKKLNKSGLVNIDELGEELVIGAKNGRLTYLEKGSGVIPADITSNLMAWGELNPQDMLDRNRPSVGISPEVHNTEINLNVSYGDMLHIEEFNGDDPDEIAKIVAKQFEKHTRDLNNSLRKYVR